VTPSRVLFVNSRVDATENPGGDTVQVVQTKRALEALGVEVDLRHPTDLADLPPFDLAHVFNLQMPESAMQVFEALQKAHRPIVLSPIYWDTWAYWFEAAERDHAKWRWPARLIGRTATRKAYVRWQEWKAPRNPAWQTQQALLTKASRVLPNSRVEADLLARTFRMHGGFAAKVDLVPNAIDPSAYRAATTPSEWFLERYGVRDFVLQVGTVSPVKNQLRLIEALFAMPVPIVIVGHTPAAMADYARQCRSLAAKRGHVVFVDHLSAAELPGIYALAAVHALPSWRETPGLVSLEAAACGCRIVSTSVGSAHEYFGDHAWYCEPDSVRSIRRAVESALNAPASDALRRHVLSKFTWRRAGEATLVAYQHLTGSA